MTATTIHTFWVEDRVMRRVILDAVDGTPLAAHITEATRDQYAMTDADAGQPTAAAAQLTAQELIQMRDAMIGDWLSDTQMTCGNGGGPTLVWVVTDSVISQIDRILDAA